MRPTAEPRAIRVQKDLLVARPFAGPQLQTATFGIHCSATQHFDKVPWPGPIMVWANLTCAKRLLVAQASIL